MTSSDPVCKLSTAHLWFHGFCYSFFYYITDVATISELKCGSEYSTAVDNLLQLNEHLRQGYEAVVVEDKSDVNEGLYQCQKHTLDSYFLGGPL